VLELAAGDKCLVTYTAEDAIEELGLRCFQWKVILCSCVFSVWHLVCHSSAKSCETRQPALIFPTL